MALHWTRQSQLTHTCAPLADHILLHLTPHVRTPCPNTVNAHALPCCHADPHVRNSFTHGRALHQVSSFVRTGELCW